MSAPTQTVYFYNPSDIVDLQTKSNLILTSYYRPTFNYGVASGDPLQDRVILWTHAKVDSEDKTLVLKYEVSTSSTFSTIVSQGETTTDSSKDYTVKVDATGLQPNTSYYYRFTTTGTDSFGNYSITSPIGLTKTLPTGSVSEVKMAVASCTSYPSGFFHVYNEIANSDVDVVLHLGDYIYEYGPGSFGAETSNLNLMRRYPEPPYEITSLNDYRRRHAQYKSDSNSKLMHSLKPMIAIWDDHEITNDAYMSGAQNHTEGTEGVWSDRVNYALQAYHEWMPIRTGSSRSKIYRTFNFGNLVNLHMIDTRLIGREKQISLADFFGLAGPGAQAAAAAKYTSPTFKILGEEQTTWLQGQLTSNTGTWCVLGNQVMMGRTEFPTTVLTAAAPLLAAAGTPVSGATIAAIGSAVSTYLTAKAKVNAGLGATLTVSESGAYYAPKYGYNFDSWDGYIYARENILSDVNALRKNFIVLTGDIHNGFQNDLTFKGLPGVTGATGSFLVGKEFVTTSITSPGLEQFLAPLDNATITTFFTQIPEDVNWMDPSRRGYLKMTFTPTTATGQWYLLDTVKANTYTSTLANTYVYTGPYI